jgi:hypothetical protein
MGQQHPKEIDIWEHNVVHNSHKGIDEATWACLLKLHNKLLIDWLALKNVNSFLLIFFNKRFIFFQIQRKRFDGAKCSSIGYLYYKNNDFLKDK